MSKNFLFMVLLSVFFCSSVSAEAPKELELKQADRNKSGIVDKKEMDIEKQGGKNQGSKVKSWWGASADTDKDGDVDEAELSAWKNKEKKYIDSDNDGIVTAKDRRTYWKKIKTKANTPLEVKYDKNHNGWLGPQEVKDLLKDRYELIKTQRQVKVESSVEEAYDINKDGVLDAEEAKAIKEDLE